VVDYVEHVKQRDRIWARAVCVKGPNARPLFADAQIVEEEITGPGITDRLIRL
jgi:hypothetical protein